MSNWNQSDWFAKALGVISLVSMIAVVWIAVVLTAENIQANGGYNHSPAGNEQSGSDTFSIKTGEGGAYELHYKPERETGAKEGVLGLSSEQVIALFTVILAVSTIWLGWSTRKLWASTDATLAHTKEATERELRAYVFVDTIDLLDGALAAPPNVPMINHPGAHLVVKNTGKTPAYDVVHDLRPDLPPAMGRVLGLK